LRIIRSLSGKRLDPAAVAALEAVYQRGEIQVPQPMPAKAAAVAAGTAAAKVIPSALAPASTVEMDRT